MKRFAEARVLRLEVELARASCRSRRQRFNRTYREEVLSAYLFEDLDQVREITWAWMREYNEERPHDALGKVPPADFRDALEKLENSTLERSA